MFQRMIDDFKHSARATVRLSSLAIATGLALFIVIVFLCVAAFVAMLQHYGPIEACLTIAGIFLLIALVFGTFYLVKRKKERQRAIAAAAARSSSASALLTDPLLLATGLQLVRAVGLKKLVPLMVIGGVALGLFVSSNSAGASDDDDD